MAAEDTIPKISVATPKHSVTTPGGPAEKMKNPKRVAQGKRLAQISQQAKAKKKAEREQAEASSKRSSYIFYLAAAGAVIVAGASYFAYGKLTKQTPSKTEQAPSKTEQTSSKDVAPIKPEETPKRKPNFVVFG